MAVAAVSGQRSIYSVVTCPVHTHSASVRPSVGIPHNFSSRSVDSSDNSILARRRHCDGAVGSTAGAIDERFRPVALRAASGSDRAVAQRI